MRVLLVGGGGREHALAWKLAASPLVGALHAAPGNPGIAGHAGLLDVRADALDDLVAAAGRQRIDLTVIGPEVPLVAGLADRLAAAGRLALGPSAAAARIEGSKAFAKALMVRHGIPTARYAAFDHAGEALGYCRRLGAPLVVKADGLAAGKGATVCRSLEEAEAAVRACLEERVFGTAGAVVVIEEFLSGEEVSLFALSNGEEALLLGSAQDHKPVLDGDRGPNTGGMGACSPVPRFGPAEEAEAMRTIVRPTIAALAKDAAPYRGVLYAGLMLTGRGARVVEFNCRWGDPEAQVLLPRLEGDLVPLLLAAARGDTLPASVRWRPEAAVCVNLVSGGYPGAYRTGLPIRGLAAAAGVPGVMVFHAGTVERSGDILTAGGRVLSVTATGPDLAGAARRAYEAARLITFDGVHYRRDIGHKAIGTA